jgi:DNA-binding LacI/PurR family transcriptional regulator
LHVLLTQLQQQLATAQARIAELEMREPTTAIFGRATRRRWRAEGCPRCRLATPKDLAVIGFDDVEIADYTGLTTVHQPLEESGGVAADPVLARLADGSRPVRHVRLPLTIVKRETA